VSQSDVVILAVPDVVLGKVSAGVMPGSADARDLVEGVVRVSYGPVLDVY
jgi:hypothetical protein